MKNLLKASLLPLYTQLSDQLNITKDEVLFCMQWGKNFPEEANTGILFVGKATNGWEQSSQNIDVLFATDGTGIFNRADQMRWVEDKKYDRISPFWRIVKKTSSALYGSYEWYDKVAWSNLYKVSHKEGNPSARLKKKRQELCIEILKEEIRILSPKFVVFLASGWDDFFFKSLFTHTNAHWQKLTWATRFHTRFCNYNGITFISSYHPQCKPETEHINTILTIITGNYKISA